MAALLAFLESIARALDAAVISPAPANDTYFPAAQTTRNTVDTNASSTGPNGTALVINAALADGFATAAPADSRPSAVTPRTPACRCRSSSSSRLPAPPTPPA